MDDKLNSYRIPSLDYYSFAGFAKVINFACLLVNALPTRLFSYHLTDIATFFRTPIALILYDIILLLYKLKSTNILLDKEIFF